MRLWIKIGIGIGSFLIIWFFYTPICLLGIDTLSFIITDATGFGFTGDGIRGVCDEENRLPVFVFGSFPVICYLVNLTRRSSPRAYELNW